MERLKQLDDDAWETLVALYADRLRRDILVSLRRRNLPEDEAEDIQQETWISAIQNIGGFEGGEKIYYWLRVISLNHIRMRYRKPRPINLDDIEAKYESNGKTLDIFLYAHSLSVPSFESEIERREQIKRICEALQSIKPQDCELFMKHYIWRQKLRSLSQEYPSLSVHNIAQRLFRTRRQIRNRLAEQIG